MDSLRQMVRERDMQHNTPKQMRTTTRPVSDRTLVCVNCRRTPDLFGLRQEWWVNHKHGDYCRHGWACREPQRGPDCPYCGGKLVEVSW